MIDKMIHLFSDIKKKIVVQPCYSRPFFFLSFILYVVSTGYYFITFAKDPYYLSSDILILISFSCLTIIYVSLLWAYFPIKTNIPFQIYFFLVIIIGSFIIIDTSANIVQSEIVSKQIPEAPEDKRYALYNTWVRHTGDSLLEGKPKVREEQIGFFSPNSSFTLLNSTVYTDEFGFRGIPHKQNQNITILIIGGSTTFGMTFKETDKPYPELVEEKLNSLFNGTMTFKVINAGYPGQSISGAVSSYESLNWSSLHADYVLFYEAVNTVPHGLVDNLNIRLIEESKQYNSFWYNIMRKYYIKNLKKDLSQKAEEVINNYNGTDYRADVLKLYKRARGDNATFILMTMPLPYNLSSQNLSYWDPMVNGQFSARINYKIVNIHDQILWNISREYNITIIDLIPLLQDKEEYFEDSVHYYQEGREIIAQEVASAISNLIIERGYE